ncbi:MAG: coproporphyrinogen III oxidase family protein [Eggerthellaceae bacterium]|nr:coproporphyrinogen III oxidase family protein [Eggerthellaceae bacterium]
MLSERVLTKIVKGMTMRQLILSPTSETHVPPAEPGRRYMLYLHVPFCERLCPFCSFNRYPFREDVARPYFQSMRKEMLMLEDLGYDFESIYVGGGTPTIMIDELCETLDLAQERFSVEEVASETNPNHLTRPYLEKLQGRVQRLSVGVQSFDDGLLKTMDRYDKYGSGAEIQERIAEALPYFDSLNVDMIFNFPTQSEDILIKDLETVATCGSRQVTFSPLYVSDATTAKMTETLGAMDYEREERYYHIVDEVLAGGSDPLYDRTTLWTFTRNGETAHGGCGPEAPLPNPRIEEYQVAYEDYPAIGSGSIAHLAGAIYVNSFSIAEYNAAFDEGRMPIMGKAELGKRDLMRYRFLLDLYKLDFSKSRFERDFGCPIEMGLPAEMAFMRANHAFSVDDQEHLKLSANGRYLVCVMYRQFLSGMNNLRDQARANLSGPERHLLFGDGKAS